MGKWKPMMEGYDFLKLMAKEVGKMSQSEMYEDAVANEHGLGKSSYFMVEFSSLFVSQLCAIVCVRNLYGNDIG